MGQSISYCTSCQNRIREADFAKGTAFRIDERAYCAACSGEALKAVPADKVGALLKNIAVQARKASSGPGTSKAMPVAPEPPPPPRPAPRSNIPLIAGAAAAVVIVILLAVVMSGSKETPVEKVAPKVADPDKKPGPEKGLAVIEKLEAFAATSTDPEAVLQRCREAQAELRGTKFEARLGEIEKRAQQTWDNSLKEARFAAFLQSVATMRKDDPGFQRRAEVRSLIQSGSALAGTNQAAVGQMLADYDRAFLDAAKAAVEDVRRQAGEFAAQARFRAAATKVDEVPGPFRETDVAKTLAPLKAEYLKKAEDKERADTEAARAEGDKRKALWAAWKPAADQSAEFLPVWGDRKEVLRLRPAATGRPCSLEREVEIPAGKGAVLALWGGREEGRAGWTLKASAGGKPAGTAQVGPDGRIWKPILLDLSAFAGKKLPFRLELTDLAPDTEAIYLSDLDVRIVADPAAALSVIAREQDPLAGWTIASSANSTYLPVIMPEFRGRTRVMCTHPFSEQKPCTIERDVTIPAKKKATLSFWVTHAHDADWELSVIVDGTTLKKELVGGEDAWRQYTFDLSAHAGKTVKISLHNAANNWSSEFGYWSDVAVTFAD